MHKYLNFTGIVFETLTWVLFLLLPLYCFKINASRRIINLIIIIDVIFTSVIYYSNIYSISTTAIQAMAINSIYYVLVLLPFVQLMKNKYIKTILIIIITIAVIYSNKATAVIVLSIVLLMSFFLSREKTIKKMFVMVGTFSVIIILYFYFNQVLIDNKIIFDISISKELWDNGRITIAMHTIEEYYRSSFIELIFGRGYNGVADAIGISAHNDYLEVLFDYGLIGFTFYLCVIFKLIKTSILLLKNKSELAIPFCSSILIFIFMSISSHLIFIPRYFLFISLFWGLTYTSISNTRKCDDLNKNI